MYDILQIVGIKVIPLDKEKKKETGDDVCNISYSFFGHDGLWPVSLYPLEDVMITLKKHLSPRPRNIFAGGFSFVLKFMIK